MTDADTGSRRTLDTMVVLLWALVVAGVFVSGLGFWWLPLLVATALRTAFVSEACGVSRRIGKIALPYDAGTVLIAFVVPIGNCFRPFRMMQELQESSSTSEARPFEGYRSPYHQEGIVPPPSPPPLPTSAVLVWQIAVACSPFAGLLHPTHRFIVSMAVLVLELAVFARLYQRFRFRMELLSPLAETSADGAERPGPSRADDDPKALREQVHRLEFEYEGLEATAASLRRSMDLSAVRKHVLATAVIVAPLILAAAYAIYWYSSWLL